MFISSVRYIIKRLHYFGIAIILLCSLHQQPVLAAPLKKYKIFIKEQEISSALIELGVKLGISIIIPENIKPQDSRRISGEYTANESLDKLLKNSSLSYKQIEPNIYLIQIKKANTKVTQSPIEEISILGYQTGSHIFRTSGRVEGPIDQITSLELERSGTQTLSDLIKFIPAVCGNSTSTAISNGGDGTTKVTLRGLPANNTLVLINGQRTTFDGLGGDSVDLNTISPAIIKEIDIYKDGASAIYGSEAIAGVVNIETLTSFDGFKLSQYAGQTYDGHSKTLVTDALWGKESNAHSVLIALSYYTQEGLFSRDRELSSSADARPLGGGDNRSSATPNARITFDDQSSVILKNNIETTTPTADDFRATTSEDLYNFNAQNSTISPSQRMSGYAFFSSDIDQNTRWHSQVIASTTDATITLASTPLFTAFIEKPITVSKDNIFNPFNIDISDVRRRLVELAPREQHNSSNSFHINSGVVFHSGSTTWKTNIFWNQSKADERNLNLVDGDKVARALGPSENCLGINIDGCEPLNVFGSLGSISDVQLNYIKAENNSMGESELKGFNIDFTGNASIGSEIPMGYAGGIEIRQEKSKLTVDTNNNSSSIIGGHFLSNTQGERAIYEAYGELLFPFEINRPWIQSLDIELATRLASSSDFEENISPKFGFKYKVNPAFAFRGTYSRGYRAPSIKELYKTGTKTYASLSDPCAIENAITLYSNCTKQSDPSLNQYLTEYKGDKKLSPEISKSFTLGLSVTPSMLPGFSITVDLFDIRLRNIIDTNPQTILNENAENGLFEELINRDNNGNITLIEAPFLNIGKRHIQGVDLSVRYNTESIYWTLNASHLRKFQEQLNQFTKKENLAGTFRDAAENGNGSLPKWKANTGLTWMQDNSEINYTVNYIKGTIEQIQSLTGPQKRKIDDWLTHNIQLQHQYYSYSFSVGIDNIFNQSPPFAASAFSDNYDAHAYDIKGRFFYFRISKLF